MAFLDPPKASAAQALRRLEEEGVRVKVLTGDNGLVTMKICSEVGLAPGRVVSGAELAALGEEEFARVAAEADVFVKLSPANQRNHYLREISLLAKALSAYPGLVVEPVALVTAPGLKPVVLTQNAGLAEALDAADGVAERLESEGVFQNGGWRIHSERGRKGLIRSPVAVLLIDFATARHYKWRVPSRDLL